MLVAGQVGERGNRVDVERDGSGYSKRMLKHHSNQGIGTQLRGSVRPFAESLTKKSVIGL